MDMLEGEVFDLSLLASKTDATRRDSLVQLGGRSEINFDGATKLFHAILQEEKKEPSLQLSVDAYLNEWRDFAPVVGSVVATVKLYDDIDELAGIMEGLENKYPTWAMLPPLVLSELVRGLFDNNIGALAEGASPSVAGEAELLPPTDVGSGTTFAKAATVGTIGAGILAVVSTISLIIALLSTGHLIVVFAIDTSGSMLLSHPTSDEFRRSTADTAYLESHRVELQKQYTASWIAIYEEEVIATASAINEFLDALALAERSVEETVVTYLPNEDTQVGRVTAPTNLIVSDDVYYRIYALWAYWGRTEGLGNWQDFNTEFASGTTRADAEEWPSLRLGKEAMLGGQGKAFEFVRSGTKWVPKDLPVGSSTRFQEARAALVAVIDDIPEGTQMGLLAFGNTPGTGFNQQCRTPQIQVEPGPEMDEQLKKALQNIWPAWGVSTPIASTIITAANSLPLDEGENYVLVLVTDGAETCQGDPVAAASNLREKYKNIDISTIGFTVVDEDRSGLQAIAEAGGGKYFDADTQDELVKALEDAVDSGLPRTWVWIFLASLGVLLARASFILVKGHILNRK